jgi:hypothetical protein
MIKTKTIFSWLLLPVILFVFAQNVNAQFSSISGLEGDLPSFWNKGNEPSGATLTWATDEFVSMGRSIKIEKSATSDSASWISQNMCDLWGPKIAKNVDLHFGAWIKTQNVNTNPASDDEKWWISFSFWDSAGSLIGSVKLPVDQSQASSTDWMADTTSVGQVSLPTDAWTMIIKFVGGKNATGTVWADNFIFTGGGGDWNTQLGVPTGWYYWMPPNGGNDGLLSNGFENTILTTEAAHSGNYSLKFDMPSGRDAHDGFIGTRRMSFNEIDPTIKPGDIIRLSVWIKANNLEPDSAFAYPSTWAVGLTPQFFTKLGNNDGWDGTGNDYQFTFPNATSFDWTQYSVDVMVPDNPETAGMGVRLHIYATFTGTVYFDDLSVTKISNPTLAEVGGFEIENPAFWYKGNQPGGSNLTWATDEFVSMGHSLKIEKVVSGDSAAWISENMCDLWGPTIAKNVDLHFGAWIKTQNINTNPTSDDEKWWLAYSFYDSAGALIGAVKLPIDQSQATSSGWIADTTSVGQVSLPTDAWKMIFTFVGGRNATGTVWADNFIFTGGGGCWNTQLGVPTGYYYWMPPGGGNDGLLNSGFENTIVTNEEAHSGNYSLKFDMPADRMVHDGFISIHRMPFEYIDSTITPGGWVRISVWVKASNLLPDSAAAYPGTWAVGLTPQFFPKLGNNVGWGGEGPDAVFTFPSVTSFDWTQFYTDFQVPDQVPDGGDPPIGMEARLHVYSTFTGTVYFDDLTIQSTTEPTDVEDANHLVPAKFEVFQNYPNPFNPTTTISYTLPKNSFVTLKVYDVLGREVKTLVNTEQKPGVYNMLWNGENNFGTKVASGIYIYRVTAGAKVQSKKMILMK